jgi:hypothetical protein
MAMRMAGGRERWEVVRVNVYVPDDLGQRVRDVLPDLNVSAVLQQALAGLLDCDHERVVCADCGVSVDGGADTLEALDRFWRELLHAWQPLVDRGGTAVGAAQVAKAVAVELGVPNAERRSLPRPPRSNRRWAS